MSVQKEFIKGTKWTTIQQIVVVALGLIRLSVLARVLEKSTFGLFAAVLFLMGLTTIFADLGISVSLYHKKNITKVQYSTLYWLNILFNIILYFLLIVATPLAIWHFNETELAAVIPIMGLNLIFAAIGKHFQIYAEKDLRFRQIAYVAIITNIIGLILAVILAYEGYEIYALVYPTLITTLAGSIAYFILMRNKYQLAYVFNFNEVKSFFKVGLFQSGSQVVDFIANQVDILLIGPLLGSEALGVYNLIKQFTMRAYRLINSGISKVSIPIFSSFNDDDNLLKTRYIQLVEKLSLLNAIIYAGFAFMAYEILHILYGSGYAPYFLIFALFSAVYFLSSVASLASILVVAKGKTQFGLYWTIFRVLLTLPLIYFLGMEYKLIGVVTGLLIFAVQAIYTYWRFLIRKVQSNINFREHLMAFVPNLLMSLMIFSLAQLAAYFIPTNLSFGFVLAIKVTIFALLTGGYLLFIRKKDMNELLALFKINFRL